MVMAIFRFIKKSIHHDHDHDRQIKIYILLKFFLKKIHGLYSGVSHLRTPFIYL